MNSTLKNRMLFSPLAGQSKIKPQGRSSKKNIHASLLLTSLVDAFSILVIFLMINSSAETSSFSSHQGLDLPKVNTVATSEKITVVRVQEGQYYLNDRKIDKNELAQALTQVHNRLKLENASVKNSLLILADKAVDYSELNPIVLQSSRAGFEELRFAAIKKE